MKTKTIYSIILLSAIAIMSSCSDSYIREHGNGKPAVVDYVRLLDPAKADSAITGAQMLTSIAIIGSNLQAVNTIYFGDTEADLNLSLVKESAIIVTVPFSLQISDNMRLITADNKVTDYPFRAFIPSPQLDGFLCDYAADGDTLTLMGNFFYEPLTVTLDGKEVEIASVNEKQLQLIVPAGAQESPVTVTTAYGESTSQFHFRDTRGLLTDFRTELYGNPWGYGAYSDEGGIDGNYYILKSAAGTAWLWDDKNLFGCYWSLYGAGLSAIVEGIADTLALRFEANIRTWTDLPMIIWFAAASPTATADDASTEKIDVDGNEAQYHWKPWLNEDGTVSNSATGGWRTYEVPLSLFKTNKEETSNERQLGDMTQYNNLNFFIFGAQVDGSKHPIEIWLDNFRIVPYKTQE